VLAYYGGLQLSSEFIGAVRKKMDETINDEGRATRLLRKQLTSELARMDVEESNLLDLASDPELATTQLRERLRRIQHQRAALKDRLGEIKLDLTLGVAFLEAALDLLEDPQELYRLSGSEQRRMLNAGIFDRIYVTEDGVTDQSFQPPFDELMAARRVVPRKGRQAVTLVGVAPDGPGNKVGLLATVLLGGGSSKTAMVEVAGIEPATPRNILVLVTGLKWL
jgi:site-specific DNA recombinase